MASPTAPPERHLLPDSATTGADGHLLVGGVDLVELAAEHGTPLFVYDEDHLRARCREAVAAWGDGVAYATKAFLCQAMAALAHEEGMCLDVATGGELHVALAAGVPADRLVLHGNNKSEAELARALAGGGGAHRGRLLRRDRPPGRAHRRAAARAAEGASAGHPGGRGPHPRVRPHRPGGLEVRLLGGLGGGGCRRWPPWSSCPGWSWWASTPTSAARSSTWSTSRRRPRCWGRSSPRSELPELVVGGGLGVAYVNGERGADRRSGPRRPARRARRPGSTRPPG